MKNKEFNETPVFEAEVIFSKMFEKMRTAKPNKKGIRLQKTQSLSDFMGETYTITIERGDKLNK